LAKVSGYDGSKEKEFLVNAILATRYESVFSYHIRSYSTRFKR